MTGASAPVADSATARDVRGMMVKASDRRAALYGGLLCELTGLLVIALAFLAPLPRWAALLIAGGVTLLALTRGALGTQGDVCRDEGLQSLWLNHLTLRIAIDGLLHQVRFGSRPEVDWRAATREAAEDIKTARDDEKVQTELGGGIGFEVAVQAVFAVVFILGRGLIGFGIAWAVNRFWPAGAAWLLG